MNKCDICGNENADGVKICERCGTSLKAAQTPEDKAGKKRNLILGIVLAAVIIAGVFWLIFGFLGKPDNSAPENYAQLLEKSHIITEESVALEVDGVKIGEDIWNYYFMSAAEEYVSVNAKTLDEVDWTKKDKNGQTALETVKFDAITKILYNTAITLRADDWGISLNDEDRERLIDIDYKKEMYGDGAYEKLYLKGEESFARLRESLILEEKIRGIVSADIKKYIDGADLTKYTNDSSATVKFIEISKNEDGTGGKAAKAQIDDIKKRLDNGEKFDEIWLEVMGEFYTKQMGIEPTKPGTIAIYKDAIAASHKNMETAALKLEIGEMSEVVETDYSYMILKRVAGYTEVLNMVVSESEIGINKTIIDASKIK